MNMLDFTKRVTEITVWFHNLIHEAVIPSSQYTECFLKKDQPRAMVLEINVKNL